MRVLVHREFKKQGVDVRSIEQPTYSIYKKDPSDFLINGLMELLDAYQRLEISMKLSRGRNKKAQQGGYAGGREAFGYKAKKGQKAIEINLDEAAAVQRLFELKELFPDWSLSELAYQMNDDGFTTQQGKKITKVQIKRILDRRPCFLGEVSCSTSSVNGGEPKGNYTKGESHGVKKERETADLMADKGYDIEMLDEVNGGNGYGIKESSNPDFVIEGKVFDCYAPTIETNVENILRNITKKTKTQAERIVLNLDQFPSEKVSETIQGILRKANPNGDLRI